MNDFQYQATYVKAQAQRLFALQDKGLASPSHGCFHLSYWRDKTSEFADARFQEAGATLGLLAHPNIFSNEIGLSQQLLLESMGASLGFWSRIQNRDGTFDEWYKGEHGFAATSFTTAAFSLAIHFLGDLITIKDVEVFRDAALRSGRWLLRHHDLVKANHEVAAAATLAILSKLFDEKQFLNAAKEKMDYAFSLQTEEGWFLEVAGMDVGYCSLLLDFAMLYVEFSKDTTCLPKIGKLTNFLVNFIHPDLTVSAEAGICQNPYVSRLGFGLLARHNVIAQEMLHRFLTFSPQFEGIAPYLSDDLRLCRWGYFPLLCHLMIDPSFAKDAPACKAESELIFWNEANVATFSSPRFHAVFAPAGGGCLRVYSRESKSKIFEDKGYVLVDGQKKYTSSGYDPTKQVTITKNTVEAEIGLFLARFLYPGFWPRLLLRILGSIPGAAIPLRKAIDWYRKSKKTALNQSAAPVSRQRVRYRLHRSVTFTDDSISAEDRLSGPNIAAMLGADLERFDKDCIIIRRTFLPSGVIETVTERARDCQTARDLRESQGDLLGELETAPAPQK